MRQGQKRQAEAPLAFFPKILDSEFSFLNSSFVRLRGYLKKRKSKAIFTRKDLKKAEGCLKDFQQSSRTLCSSWCTVFGLPFLNSEFFDFNPMFYALCPLPLRRRLNVMGDDFRDLSLRPGGRAASVDAAISKNKR